LVGGEGAYTITIFAQQLQADKMQPAMVCVCSGAVVQFDEVLVRALFVP
jgi:hypothetical protein